MPPIRTPTLSTWRAIGLSVALRRQNLPYVTPEVLSTARTMLHQYLKVRVKTPLVGPRREEVLQAMDRYVQENFVGKDSYASFRIDFDMLMWRLWTATERRELTAEELQQRDRQREWMRDYIRSQPIPEEMKYVPQYSYDNRLKLLESEVFGEPLSPFFHEPMSDEEFARFTKDMDRFKEHVQVPSPRLAFAPSDIFRTVVGVREQSLLNRWPPGFLLSGLGADGTRGFSFRWAASDTCGPVGVTGGKRYYLDVGKPQSVAQDAPLDAEATQKWLAENKKGDVEFDAATGRLLPVRGAKLATVDETEWYKLDRIPMAELQRRVRDTPVDSMSVPHFSEPGSPEAQRAFRRWPTLVVESAEGKLALVRVLNSNGGDGTVNLQVRPRPLARSLPLSSGRGGIRFAR